jgi:hypothetical protein
VDGDELDGRSARPSPLSDSQLSNILGRTNHFHRVPGIDPGIKTSGQWPHDLETLIHELCGHTGR